MKGKIDISKKQFATLFLITVVFLMTLPLFLPFQDVITRFLAFSGLAGLIQNYIVPTEVKFVVAFLRILGMAATGDTRIIVLQGGVDGDFKAQIIWSCIGWQSVVLLAVTLITGLKGQHSVSSKIEVVIIGLMGTFWVNIFRIVIIYILGYHFGQLIAVLFHNFAGTLMVIAWLFFFWWLSYSFVLEEKMENAK